MLPNFIIIGARKCGTTSLCHYLRQHPSVFMCVPKEPNFFSGGVPKDPGFSLDGERIATLEAYEALFDEVDGEVALGEASVEYLHSEEAPAYIREIIPDARLIVILRDPAERAYSHYNMFMRYGDIPCEPYLDRLREARHEKNYNLTGVPLSRYAKPLRRYLNHFGREQLQVLLYDDFEKDNQRVLKAVFEHIGVAPSYEPNVEHRHNTSYQPRNKRLNHLVWKKSALKNAVKALLPTFVQKRLSQVMHRLNRAPVPPLSSEARSIIIDVLRDDIEQTEELLGRDLSAWKSSSTTATKA